MTIGTKRKEEIIEFKRYGIYEQYVPISLPVIFYSVEKNCLGVWQVWEMVTEKAGQPIAGYKTKKEAIQNMLEIMYRKGPQVYRVNKTVKR